MDQVMALGSSPGQGTAMAVGGKQSIYLSLFPTVLASSDMPLSPTHVPFCLALLLPFCYPVLTHHNSAQWPSTSGGAVLFLWNPGLACLFFYCSDKTH